MAFASGILLLAASTAGVAAGTGDLGAARAATESYRDVAAAETGGYALPPEGPLHECITSTDGSGAMGLHYINGDLVGDAELDPASPEALVYAPSADGGLVLAALEYVVFADAWDEANATPPMMFGEMFMLVEEPNRYELPSFYALHAWIWTGNPSGTFAAFNPDVSCAAAMPDTAMAAPGMPVAGVAAFGVAAVFLLGATASIARRRR